MKRILITGITGFAGSHLAELLCAQSDSKVHGTYLTDANVTYVDSIQEKVILHKIDLTDEQAVTGLIGETTYDEIYHLAAFPSPKDSFENPGHYLHNNADAELYILEALRKQQRLETKILVVSSAEVYGLVNSKDLPLDENTPLRPVSPYGVSKITQDYLALQYYLTYGMKIIRVRPFGHIGPRLSDQFAASAFAKKIAEIEAGTREPILTVGNLGAKRDLTDVRDIVKAYALLMEKGESGEVYNLGRGKSYEIKDVLNMLLSMTKMKIEIKEDTTLLRPIDIPDLRSNNTKLVHATGWEPIIDLEKSLEDTLNYWRETIR